jgi:hypothetical protein
VPDTLYYEIHFECLVPYVMSSIKSDINSSAFEFGTGSSDVIGMDWGSVSGFSPIQRLLVGRQT